MILDKSYVGGIRSLDQIQLALENQFYLEQCANIRLHQLQLWPIKVDKQFSMYNVKSKF
jgi:hypothetical protein